MPNYAYTARDKTGKVVSGSLEGDNEAHVVERLRGMGYIISGLSEQKEAVKFESFFERFQRVKGKDLVAFSRQFATMINSGLPLARCLSVLAEQTENPLLSKTILAVLQDVEGGQTLSAALEKHPRIFSELLVSMVKAGETGGILDDVLLRIAENLEKSEDLQKKIKSAMAYPALMLIMSIALVLVMITFIVPVFAGMFKTLGGKLPLPTQMLVSLSSFIRGTWFIGLPVTIAIIFGIRRLLKVPTVRYQYDKFKLRVPVFGRLSRRNALSRFSRTLGILTAAGVPILESLEVVERTVGNMLIAEEVERARLAVKEGQTVAKPLGDSAVFPPMVVQMIAVGEESGALDTMLTKIADFYDKEVAAAVEALTSLIEPLMIVVVGGIIGVILLSLYLPMFQLASLIKK